MKRKTDNTLKPWFAISKFVYDRWETLGTRGTFGGYGDCSVKSFSEEKAARAAAKRYGPGKYRVEKFDGTKTGITWNSEYMEEFTIEEN